MVVNGTVLGAPGQAICTITVSTGSGQFSCQGWTDYSTPALMGILHVSPTQRWATASSFPPDISGGNQHNATYYSQILEGFQYTIAGTAISPSAPVLIFTSFGAASSSPLVGTAATLWLDSGSSWSVPATLASSTSSERWDSLVSTGAATAGQTVSLLYYHQFFVNFAYSVTGGGTAYAPPSVSFTAFGASAQGTQNWVDAGSAYGYTNPLAGSSAVERWFTSTPAGAISAAGTVSAVYFHQFAFSMGFAVTGEGIYNNPRLNFTTLGIVALRQVNATQATFWVDAGSGWTVSSLLPSSTSSERWITKQATSGTAAAPLEAHLLYYHQYLATLHYSINGPGGSPGVPRMNYTSFGASLLPSMDSSASTTYWMDAFSAWSVPLTLPGGHGERWLSNATGLIPVNTAFQVDVQYTHQFFVQAGASTPSGGKVGTVSAWHDQGSSVILNETTAKLWSFAYWHGLTPFSYNGTSRLPTLLVTGAANETAVFFPGLTIFTDQLGSVAYAYGSIIGTVPQGTNSTIYPPPGYNITLTAIPNTVEIVFNGWTVGVPGALLQSGLGSKLQTSLSIESPSAVHATFSVDYTDIRTFTVAAIGVFIAAAYVFVIRRGFAPRIRQK